MQLDEAQHHQARVRALTLAAGQHAADAWRRVTPGDIARSWQSHLAMAVRVLTAAQTAAAALADPYTAAALDAQNIQADPTGQIRPGAFAGASDGRDLASLLIQPVIAAKIAIRQGSNVTDALQVGRNLLDRIVATQVPDAARQAESAAIAARPHVVYVRQLQLPSCARCAILAGAVYHWNAGFARHPGCDCVHIPSSENVAEDLTTDVSKAFGSGKVTGLSDGDQKAIDDGADPGQVVNAQRGMYTTTAYGRKNLSATLEGVTRRGRYGQAETAAGRSAGRSPRLRPEEIYRIAGDDRTEAVRLLKRFGYLT